MKLRFILFIGLLLVALVFSIYVQVTNPTLTHAQLWAKYPIPYLIMGVAYLGIIGYYLILIFRRK